LGFGHGTGGPLYRVGFALLRRRSPTQGVFVKLSARNQLTGTVTSVNRGEAIANVVLEIAGQRLVASVTTEAVDDLGLEAGSPVTAVIKASDVILATG
jgi:molybdopterin-binding protein